MSDGVKILYNGGDAFYPQPTPYVALDAANIFYNSRWAQQENLTLNGWVTGCTYPAIVSAYNQIVNNFKTNYQDLEIWQTQNGQSGRVFLKQNTEVRSISITDNRWIGGMQYAIALSCYPSGYFSGYFGVLEPVETWAFDEQQDATMQIAHTLSCRPFNTSKFGSNALDNARIWAFARTGLANSILPIFISGVSPSNYFITTQSETIDRFNGNYSIVENYTNDLARSGYGVVRYSANVASGNSLITVSLNGVVQGTNQDINSVRSTFANLDIPAIAVKTYGDIFNQQNLNVIPLRKSFNEDAFNTRLAFDYTFDNDTSPPVYFDYDVSLSVGTNGRIATDIRGIIRVKGGTLSEKLAAAQTYASSLSLYNLCIPFYSTFDVSSIVQLNSVPLSYNKVVNVTNGTVEMSARYDNRQRYNAALDEFDPVISITPATVKVDSKPILNGNGSYSVVNLGYANRPVVSIRGTARANELYPYATAAAAVKMEAFQMLSQYTSMANPILEQSQINRDRTDERLINFNFIWSLNALFRQGPSSLSSLNV